MPYARLEALMQHFQAEAFQNSSLGLLQHLGDSKQTAFMTTVVDNRLLPQTIKGYIILHGVGSQPHRQGGGVSDMISSMQVERPRSIPVLLEWDLGYVLETLAKPPYEPLSGASLKHLGYRESSSHHISCAIRTLAPDRKRSNIEN